MNNFLYDTIHNVGIDLTSIQQDKLNKYYEMLVEKNKVVNLTAITEYNDVVIKHYADSLAIIHAVDITKVDSIIDIGTGAGFPGIVLKIVYPDIDIVLLDSLNKRINFLNEVIDELELANIRCIHGRAEDFARQKEYREKFDLCVSRAVANLSTLTEYCLPYVKVSGKFISYKAEDCSNEINDAKKSIQILGGVNSSTEEYHIPKTDITRKFVIIEKTKKTSLIYPRKAGLPSKEPIK